MRPPSRSPRFLLALLFLPLAQLLACSNDNSGSVLLTCGNGVVETGEECDDGGTCQGGPNDGARCRVGLPAQGQEDVCTSSAPCSLGLGGGTCRGPFQPEVYQGKACAESSETSDCCPAENPSCGNSCIGQCMGGAANGDACRTDEECVRSGSCVVDDTDSCTSICRFPVCGDGVINTGLEQCDGFNLGGNSCDTLRFGEGLLTCSAECRFDVSACGPPFTATPTDTATPRATETPTPFPSGVATFTFTPPPTPTPTPTVEGGAVCGDLLLEVGENCIEPATAPAPVIPDPLGDRSGQRCDQDCTGTACAAGGTQVSFPLTLLPPTAREPSSVTVFIGYRATQLLIPGSGGLNPMVRASVRLTSSSATFQANDREYGMRLVISDSSELRDEIATITFDVCADAQGPSLDDVSCIVEACAGPGSSIEGCTCTFEPAAGG